MNLIPYLVALLLAFIVEALVEYHLAPIVKLLETKWGFLYDLELAKYVTLLVGVPLAFAYGLDLIMTYLGATPKPAWIGIVVTGYAISRGANFLHDMAKKYLGLST